MSPKAKESARYPWTCDRGVKQVVSPARRISYQPIHSSSHRMVYLWTVRTALVDVMTLCYCIDMLALCQTLLIWLVMGEVSNGSVMTRTPGTSTMKLVSSPAELSIVHAV